MGDTEIGWTHRPKDGGDGRIRRDRRADALRAARRVLDDAVTLRDAQAAAGIGRTYLKEAIAQIKAERARSAS